ncbi:putative WD domain, G-beta repeat [Leishmania utingensis]|uniref:WD domain, G-beta repeat n=1 Tax=Leishmania utingensis TaxID=653362 RepID=A0AAW2ZYF0_9TRYP
MSVVPRLRTAGLSVNTREDAAVYAETKSFHAEGAVVTMAASYNSTMWLAMQDGRVEVRDVHTGQVVHVFAVAGVRQRRSKVWCMLSVYNSIHQEAQLWMGLSSGAIEVYTENYQLRWQLSKHLSGVYCLAQYRGDVAYAGSSDFTITQWRVADGRLLRVLTGHSNYVRCLYAEGNALVSGSDDNTVRVWDTSSGTSLQQYKHLHRESGGVSALCRVGTAMWSGDHSGVIAVWRLKDGEALLMCHQVQGRVTSLRKVGARVYAGSAEGRIYVFNASDCTVVSRLDDHLGSNISAIACAVEVNRYFVWSGSADNTIQCWHHDEHQPMTAEHEGALDMQWYYTTQLPYLQANEALLEQQRELMELVVLSSGSDDAVRSFLANLGEGHETAAARYWLLNGKVKQTQKRCDAMEEEIRAIDVAVERKAQTLEVLRRQLARLTEALASSRLQPPLPGGAPVPASMATELPAARASLSPPLVTIPPPSDTSALPSSPPSGIAAPPRPTTLASALPSVLPPPPLQVMVPAASLPLPSMAPVPERSSSPPRIMTGTQVTLSRSYEPVLSSLPPPPFTAGSRPTMEALLRMDGSGTAVPPPPAAVVPLPPVAAAPLPPSTGGVEPLGELPAKAATLPLTRRMSF